MPIRDVFGELGGLTVASMVTGLLPLVLATAYVIRPSEHRLQLLRPLSLATIFSGLAGTLTGCITMLRGLSATNTFELRTMHAMAAGAAEMLMPAFFAFGCLTAAWLLAAAGMARRPAP